MAAFNMTQPLPTQSLGMVNAAMIAPMTGVSSMVPPIGSINTGTYIKRINNASFFIFIFFIVFYYSNFYFLLQVRELLHQ